MKDSHIMNQEYRNLANELDSYGLAHLKSHQLRKLNEEIEHLRHEDAPAYTL